MILSVSRRTDIPAFYPRWFINRVRDGFVYVKNPFNANQISRIPLGKDVVDCIVFWSKNPKPLMKYLPEINEKYEGAFYFQYTINPYGKEMEPALPPLDQRIETFIRLAEEYGPKRVIWRYDPILLNDLYSVEWHVDSFRGIFNQLKDYIDTCVISFVDMYAKTKSNTKEYGIRAPEREEMYRIASEFSKILKESNVSLRTCAEGIDLKSFGIEPNSCIDRGRIEDITGYEIKGKPDKQRENCLCMECADIGIYNTCKHGCRYCYANFNENLVKKAVEEHDDDSPLLTGTLNPKAIVTVYAKAKSLKTNANQIDQLTLFDMIKQIK